MEQARSSFHKARNVLEEDDVMHLQPLFDYAIGQPLTEFCKFVVQSILLLKISRQICEAWALVVQVLISNYRAEFTGRHEHADDFTW